MSPSRRTLLAALPMAWLAAPAMAARPSIAPLTEADKALVAEASAYLQGLSQVRGRFAQTNARGAVTRGDLYIKRPGKARFAYDPPANLLVVSDGYNVSVYDGRLKTFESYPLGATPLALFLARNIRLDRGVVISRVDRYADGFAITARDGRREAEGQITLTFSNTPIALREWVVTDAQGQTTRVSISGLQPAPNLSPSLFVLRDPNPRRSGTARP